MRANECGTVGCLLGHGARAFDYVKTVYYNALGFDYSKFSSINFPALHKDYGGLYGEKWNFLFDADWQDFQPTFSQAMERLNYFIDNNGELPEWDYATTLNECFKN